jgi:hypothetical protein
MLQNQAPLLRKIAGHFGKRTNALLANRAIAKDDHAFLFRLTGDELLPAVDVVGRAGEGGVGHDVYGERGDVGRSDDAPDGERGAKLIAAVV